MRKDTFTVTLHPVAQHLLIRINQTKKKGRLRRLHRCPLLQLCATATSTGSPSNTLLVGDRSNGVTNGTDGSRVNVGLKEMSEPHVDDLWCALAPPADSLGLLDQLPIRHTASPLADKIEGPINLRIPCGHLEFLRTQLLDADLGPILDRGPSCKMA